MAAWLVDRDILPGAAIEPGIEVGATDRLVVIAQRSKPAA
jgi:hypothetical protein